MKAMVAAGAPGPARRRPLAKAAAGAGGCLAIAFAAVLTKTGDQTCEPTAAFADAMSAHASGVVLVSSVLVSALVLYNWNASFGQRFTDIVLLATWMTLIAYAYAAAAEVVLFFRERALFSQARLVRDTVVASLAFAYSVWAIWGSGQEWLAKGFMLLLFGIPVFVFMKWRQSRAPLHVPAEWKATAPEHTQAAVH